VLTPVVEDLVRRGLVERKRHDSDRRTYSLNLTPAGKKILDDDPLRAPARTQP
jgi:DNA-binding MarR family transcriptional regulator